MGPFTGVNTRGFGKYDKEIRAAISVVRRIWIGLLITVLGAGLISLISALSAETIGFFVAVALIVLLCFLIGDLVVTVLGLD